MPSETEPHPLRVALVGVGSAATRAHLPALSLAERRGETELVGLCDRDPARRASAAADFPGARDFDDNVAMLDNTEPELLVVATPPSAHLDEIAAALERGVDVLCEKPLGLSTADVGTLGALLAGHPECAVATVSQYSHAPAWGALARAAAGALRDGEQLSLHVVVERPGTDPLSAGGWREDAAAEGGILGDHAVHYLSLARMLTPRLTLVASQRLGAGRSASATLRLRAGNGGEITVDVSYAASVRRNLIRLDRPAQCLSMAWEDGTLAIVHNGVPSPPRQVGSLSDRSFVNRLYEPMYARLLADLRSSPARAAMTGHTLDVAGLLAAALAR